MENTKSEKSVVFKQSLNYVTKLLSTAIIVVLLLVGAFLIYYVISAKIISKQAGAVPKLSLYTIVSGSMEPAIKVYDVILDVRVDDVSTIKKGDVITFKSTSSISSDKTVTHRVHDIKIINGSYEFVTKGDNNLTADSDTAKANNIIGKTVLKIPQLGRIQFFLSTKLGWILVILLPALGIIIYDIMKLFKIVGVKDTAENLEADFKLSETIKKEEDKQIEKTLEQIKKNQNLFINNKADNQVIDSMKKTDKLDINLYLTSINRSQTNGDQPPENKN